MKTLELVTVRFNGTSGYTAGKVFANGEFLCNSLEDEVRQIDGTPVGAWKIFGQTAIPRGRYRVKLTPSQKFGRILPELYGVEGFIAIRSHSGNEVKHTEGCILVGMPDGNDKDAWLGNSRIAEELLVSTIDKAITQGKSVYWTIA
jgi:hypothetical protein